MARPSTRPGLEREPPVVFGFSLTPAEAALLRARAAAAGQSVSEWLRQWLRPMLMTSPEPPLSS